MGLNVGTPAGLEAQGVQNTLIVLVATRQMVISSSFASSNGQYWAGIRDRMTYIITLDMGIAKPYFRRLGGATQRGYLDCGVFRLLG